MFQSGKVNQPPSNRGASAEIDSVESVVQKGRVLSGFSPCDFNDPSPDDFFAVEPPAVPSLFPEEGHATSISTKRRLQSFLNPPCTSIRTKS